ncbi:hypothetical protein JW916_14265 [Candidatus Sumerlaeota bacterium]|nr:hypothetical protein [Candidatus Sumerlaeota bacterium]
MVLGIRFRSTTVSAPPFIALFIALTLSPLPCAGWTLDSSPIGWASVDALGQNGTTGGAGGTVVTAHNRSELEYYCGLAGSYVIQVEGTIAMSPLGRKATVASDKTIVGIGDNPTILYGGFSLNTVHNVVFQNLTIRDSYVMGDWDGKDNDNDGIALRTSHHIWIDHCHLHRGGDGLLDATITSSYITVSWCVFSYHNKGCGFGVGTLEDPERITVHHSWFVNTHQRNTRNEQARVHHFNNYWTGITSYCNNSKTNTQVLIENCYFKSSKTPHDEEEGLIRAVGNLYPDTTGVAESSGDTTTVPPPPYTYTLDAAADVPAIVVAGAGPNGGHVYSDDLTQTVKVNFLVSGKTTMYGYLNDYGAAFGDRGGGFTYGWDASNSGNAFWREELNYSGTSMVPVEEDRRLNGGVTFGNGTRTWEIQLDNDNYDVLVACGDPLGPPYSSVNAVNTIDVEGTTLTDPDGADHYDEYETTVSVADGRLTIGQATGGSEARICYVEIAAAAPTPTPTSTPTPPVTAVDAESWMLYR